MDSHCQAPPRATGVSLHWALFASYLKRRLKVQRSKWYGRQTQVDAFTCVRRFHGCCTTSNLRHSAQSRLAKFSSLPADIATTPRMSYTGLHSTPSAEQDQHSEIEGSAGSEDDGFIPVTDSTSHYRGVRLRLPLLLLCCLASLVVYVSRFTAFGKMENGVDRRSEVISLSESLQSAKALVFNAINAASKRGPHELRELDPLPTILAVPWTHSCTSYSMLLVIIPPTRSSTRCSEKRRSC